jgi:hypothetical protein
VGHCQGSRETQHRKAKAAQAGRLQDGTELVAPCRSDVMTGAPFNMTAVFGKRFLSAWRCVPCVRPLRKERRLHHSTDRKPATPATLPAAVPTVLRRAAIEAAVEAHNRLHPDAPLPRSTARLLLS